MAMAEKKVMLPSKRPLVEEYDSEEENDEKPRPKSMNNKLSFYILTMLCILVPYAADMILLIGTVQIGLFWLRLLLVYKTFKLADRIFDLQ